MAQLIDWMQQGRIRPRLSHCFELSRFAEAMEVVLSRRNSGKVALKIGDA